MAEGLAQAMSAAIAVHQAARDPLAYPWVTYAWVILLAVAGGVANFVAKVRAGETRPFNFVELVGEMFVAGFVGVLTFLLCEYASVDRLLSAVFIGISGHMGSRALFLLERWAAANLERRTGIAVRLDADQEDKRQ